MRAPRYPTPHTLSKEHLQAITAISQGLARATSPRAIRLYGQLIKELTEARQNSGKLHRITPVARLILTKCMGQTMDAKAIAMVCGKAPGGKSIKDAIRLLREMGRIEIIGAERPPRYRILKKSEKIIRHKSLRTQ